ncbi:ADYC domain-containing protein [Nannocystis pusilla]|uniref:ADYC domain-containing protein n=1 Tax=Nannocystis pusilla TaxID=889268 RepID=A0ABS7TTR9_9BACT|nr:ADYC domain-containing protein [Nannocystis pusilla]MBZ5711642.1 hypothetical protein [Nannocystis pusilla]
MTPTIPRLSTALALVLVAPACTTEETDPGVEFRDTSWGCGSGCPTNSPHANQYDVPELNLDGLPNFDGVTLVGFRDGADNFYELTATDDELILLDAQGNPSKAGQGLTGLRIELGNALGETEYIHVLGYTSLIESWAVGTKPMSAYALAYADTETGRLVNVCPDYYADPYATVVTIIDGERYDGTTKSVMPNEAGWITLACEGQAVYKMKRLGYGPHINFANTPKPSTVEQRNATLRMITATYCGHSKNFTSYTQEGTKILWANQVGNVDWRKAGALPEAVWDQNGAVCWNTHRSTLVPNCDPVPCTAADVGEWMTWLPIP